MLSIGTLQERPLVIPKMTLPRVSLSWIRSLLTLIVVTSLLSSSVVEAANFSPSLSTINIHQRRGGGGGGASDGFPITVAYQGEPGAYSEKATRELLGAKVTAVGSK